MLVKNITALVTVFCCFSGWLYFLYLLSGPDERIHFPRDLSQLIELKSVLEEYAEVKAAYTLLFFCSAYLYKQTFAIPGSVFLNLLSGALYGNIRGFLLVCILSGSGASLCYILSKNFGKAILIKYIPERVKYFKTMVDESQSENRLFGFLISLRVFPMTPNWLINISSPIVGVPLGSFFLSVLLGLAPYNFITCNAGSALSELQSLDDIISWRIGLGLGLLALGIINPVNIYRKVFKVKTKE